MEIKIQGKALKNLVYNSLRAGLPNHRLTENDNFIIVQDSKNVCRVNIDKQQVFVTEPTFNYNRQLIVGLLLFMVMPINFLSFMYLPFLVGFLLSLLPSVIVLFIVYKRTHKTQYNEFLDEYDLFQSISSVIKKSFSTSLI